MQPMGSQMGMVPAGSHMLPGTHIGPQAQGALQESRMARRPSFLDEEGRAQAAQEQDCGSGSSYSVHEPDDLLSTDELLV